MRRNSVLLGFSGGVDSCASALSLLEQGYDVTAMTLNTIGNDSMLRNAATQAAAIGIPLIIDDVRDIFERHVVQPFVDQYLMGSTPSPCVICNTKIKWQRLYEVMLQRGFDRIATGHYFKIVQHGDKFYVSRADDRQKDQSYYLWGLPQHILSCAVTPMGDRIKSVVKQTVDIGSDQKESMGVCFLEGSGYGEFIRGRCGDFDFGDVMNSQGAVIAHHKGYPFYTIGQKRGFISIDKNDSRSEVKLPDNMSVINIDSINNRLMAGADKDLYNTRFVAVGCMAVDVGELIDSEGISMVVRGFGDNPKGYVKIYEGEVSGTLIVESEQPVWAVAKGQPMVFYSGNRVVGGGFFDKFD